MLNCYGSLAWRYGVLHTYSYCPLKRLTAILLVLIGAVASVNAGPTASPYLTSRAVVILPSPFTEKTL